MLYDFAMRGREFCDAGLPYIILATEHKKLYDRGGNRMFRIQRPNISACPVKFKEDLQKQYSRVSTVSVATIVTAAAMPSTSVGSCMTSWCRRVGSWLRIQCLAFAWLVERISKCRSHRKVRRKAA